MNANIYLPSQLTEKPAKRQKIIPTIQQILPGQHITSTTGYLRGHGTYEDSGNLISTVSGVVEHVNKLISVVPLKARYNGDVGDVIVGRITDVGSKKWRVDVNAKQDAILLLSSINLPGGTLRRRTEEDALQMRNFFVENDLISAEVQQFYSDGAMALHTRSLKYGKLHDGLFISVPPALIKREKSHFVTLDCQVDVILGNNGYIFISATPKGEKLLDGGMKDEALLSDQILSPEERAQRKQDRLRICRVRNCIAALAQQFIAIYKQTITETYDCSLVHAHPKELLNREVIFEITKKSAQRTDHFVESKE